MFVEVGKMLEESLSGLMAIQWDDASVLAWPVASHSRFHHPALGTATASDTAIVNRR